MSRLIDADALKAAHGMKDDCADCDKELRGKSRSCEFDRIYSLMDFCGWVDDAPTIKPERKNGRWAEFDSDEDKSDIIKCPCCKHMFTVDSYHWTDIGFVKDDFNFCPNCGEDIRGEQNG